MTQAKSVLVLEDDPQWQVIVSQLLRKVDGDVSIRCVPSTQEAMELLAVGEHFDLVVADQFLDGSLTGLDFYRHMRGLHDQTSFVMLSGLERSEFRGLTIADDESPLFVPKSKVFKTFDEVIRGELIEETNEKGGLLFLITGSAIAFAASHLLHTKPAEVSHFNAPKAAVLNHPVVMKKRVFVDDQLKEQMKRIVNRADAIDKKVSQQ